MGASRHGLIDGPAADDDLGASFVRRALAAAALRAGGLAPGVAGAGALGIVWGGRRHCCRLLLLELEEKELLKSNGARALCQRGVGVVEKTV